MGDKGTPLTPEQLGDLARLYAEHGNAAAVARELGVHKSTVTRALDRLGKQRRATLQEGALLSGLVDGRERIDRAVRRVSKKLWSALKDPPAGTPPTSPLWAPDAQSIQQLGSTLARLVTVQTALDRREEQRRQAGLTRRKTRSEIAALEARVSELPPMEVLKAKLSPAAIVELVRGLTTEQLVAATALTEPEEAHPTKGG